jgi:kinetochor protein Mis14/NSL1
LAERLKVLSTQIEDLTLHLANQRRTAPLQAAASYAARLDREDEEFEHARRVAEQEGREKSRQQEQTAEGDAFNAIMVGTQGIKNWGECEKSWEQATGQLVHVKQNIGATSARLVQARDAAVYLHQLGN